LAFFFFSSPYFVSPCLSIEAVEMKSCDLIICRKTGGAIYELQMSFPSEFRVRLPASCFFLLLPLKRSKENEAIYQEVGMVERKMCQ
jgi:hypothetical protein